MAVMEFKKMVLYDDGWDGWTKAGMPVDSTIEKF
jgi:3-mercaptopyruvate sulfurtransferase SseA